MIVIKILLKLVKKISACNRNLSAKASHFFSKTKLRKENFITFIICNGSENKEKIIKYSVAFINEY